MEQGRLHDLAATEGEQLLDQPRRPVDGHLNLRERLEHRVILGDVEPRELHEMVGQVPNVVFPGGAVVESTDSEGFALPQSRVAVYYGAADTVVCVAYTTVEELIDAARAQ